MGKKPKKEKKLPEIEITEFPACCCDHQKIQSGLNKKNKSLIISNKVKYFTERELKKLNIFLRSIVGSSALNLEEYNFNFKIYFPNTANSDIQKVIDLFYPSKNVKLSTWNTTKLNNVKTAFNLITDFINVTVTQVTNLNDADYVLCYASNIPAGGDATFPYELDLFPEELKDKLYIFFSTEYNTYSWERGTFYFSLILHLINHTLGLAHTYDLGNNSELIPGALFQDKSISQGLAYANNNFSTLMSGINIPSAINEKDKTIYSRNLMSLDLQALRFYYNVSNNQKYIDNWVDLTCPIRVTQTIVTPIEGAEINLIAPTDFESAIYNLNMLPLEISPFCNKYTPNDLISSYCKGYIQTGNYENLTASFLDMNSKIISVKSDYPTLNIYFGDIPYNSTINVDIIKTVRFLLFFKGKVTDYIFTTDPSDIFFIQNKVNLNTIQILNISKINFWQTNFSINEL